jgi:hypothetical protein
MAVTKSDRGKHIISAAKSLKRYQLASPQIAKFLHASAQAGRAGLFAAALKNAGDVTLERAEVFAAQEGFSPLELEGKSSASVLSRSGESTCHRNASWRSFVLGRDACFLGQRNF